MKTLKKSTPIWLVLINILLHSEEIRSFPGNNDGYLSNSPVTPSITQKAWGTERPTVFHPTQSQLTSGTKKLDYFDSSEESLERNCPPGMFYHFHGKRCVSRRCFGGNKKRDSNTGQCLIEESYRGYYDEPVMKSSKGGSSIHYSGIRLRAAMSSHGRRGR